jgi:hypothetical protein
MDKHYAAEQMQQAAYERGLGAQLGNQKQVMQAASTNQCSAPPTPAGVMDLIETAHAALGGLQDSLGTLRAVLHPVTLPLLDSGEGCLQQAPSDAPAVSALRALIDRISSTQGGVIELAKSIRV